MSNYALDVVKGFYYYAKDGFKGFASDYQQNTDAQAQSLSAFLEGGYLNPDDSKSTTGKVVKTAGVAVQKIGADIASIPLIGSSVAAHPIDSTKSVLDTFIINPAKSIYTAGSLACTKNAGEGIKQAWKETSLKDVGKFIGETTVVVASGAASIKGLEVVHAAHIAKASNTAKTAALATTLQETKTAAQQAVRTRPRIKTAKYTTKEGTIKLTTCKNRQDGAFLQKQTNYTTDGIRTKTSINGFNGKKYVSEQRFFDENGSIKEIHKNHHISGRTYRIEKYNSNHKLEKAENYTEDGLKLRYSEHYDKNGKFLTIAQN